MNLRKVILLVIAVLVIAAAFGACAPAATADKPVWTVTVEGAGKAEFTSLDYAKLDEVKVEVTNKDETKSIWEGMLMKDVIDYLGITEYSSITMTATDDYAQDYTPDIVNDSKTIIATKVDGEALTADDGYVEAVAGNQPSKMSVKKLAGMTVNK